MTRSIEKKNPNARPGTLFLGVIWYKLRVRVSSGFLLGGPLSAGASCHSEGATGSLTLGVSKCDYLFLTVPLLPAGPGYISGSSISGRVHRTHWGPVKNPARAESQRAPQRTYTLPSREFVFTDWCAFFYLVIKWGMWRINAPMG